MKDEQVPAMPDVTPAQLQALIVMVVTQLVAAQWVDGDTAQVMIQVAGVVLPVVWVVADAVIRYARNRHVAAVRVAEVAAAGNVEAARAGATYMTNVVNREGA